MVDDRGSPNRYNGSVDVKYKGIYRESKIKK